MSATDLVDRHPPGPAAVPHPGECVICFVDRVTRAHGCTGRLTWAAMWRDRCAPRATALERRLGAKGGYCDCEVLMNAYVRRELASAVARGLWTDEEERFEERAPEPCLGVRTGSAQPCRHWLPRGRGRW